MQLHQLLRYISSGTPILIFDIEGVEICNVYDKEDINVDLYEYIIFEVGIVNFFGDTKLTITIQK